MKGGSQLSLPQPAVFFRFHHVPIPTTSQALYVGVADTDMPANKNPWALALWILQPSMFSLNFLILKPRERNSRRPHGPSHNPAACPRRTVTPGWKLYLVSDLLSLLWSLAGEDSLSPGSGGQAEEPPP